MPYTADRTCETSSTGGSGTLTLAGAVAGYQTFATALGTGFIGLVEYAITDTSNNWETGIGTYTQSGTTLTRETVRASSNAGALVTFTGTQTVFLTFNAAEAKGAGRGAQWMVAKAWALP